MRAITQQALGGPEVLELVDVRSPSPAPTEVLVRVAAAGVNPVDWKVRGARRLPRRAAVHGRLGRRRHGGGALGPGVTRFAVGDRVFGMPRFPREAAAYAEYVTSPSRQLARTPEGLSDVEAAALPLAGLTAWQALVETADVQPGPARARAGSRRRRRSSRRADREGARRARDRHGALGQARRSSPSWGSTRRSTTRRSRSRRPSATSTSCSISSATRRPPARSRTLRDGGLFIVVPSAAGVESLGSSRANACA